MSRKTLECQLLGSVTISAGGYKFGGRNSFLNNECSAGLWRGLKGSRQEINISLLVEKPVPDQLVSLITMALASTRLASSGLPRSCCESEFPYCLTILHIYFVYLFFIDCFYR